jgi:TonB family protein
MRNAMFAAAALHVAAFVYAPPYEPRFESMKAKPMRLVQASFAVGGGSELSPGARTGPTSPAFQGGARVAEPVPTTEPAVTTARASTEAGQGHGGGPGGGSGVGSWESEEAPEVFYAYDTAPQVTRRYLPDYPEAVRQAGAEGMVVVNANVDRTGRVVRAWVAQSDAPEALLDLALESVYHWEFTPGKQNGIPVQCTVSVPFEFSLKKTFELTEKK